MVTGAIVRNLINTSYYTLPEEVREATKISILDTLGVMLPPTTLEKSCVSIYELFREAGGREESTLMGFGGKAPSWVAAFINGSLTHAMDYDDTTDDPPCHPTAISLAGALAVAEKIGGVNGKDFLTAVALGSDLGVRLSGCTTASILSFPFFNVSTIGPLTSAAAVGKLIGLSETEMLNALGLALHRVAGIDTNTHAPDSDLRSIRDGFSHKEGVICALMAGKGIAACKDAIEQLFRVYYKGEYDPRLIVIDLGKKYRGSEASIKPWPTCRETHGYIEAILKIIKGQDIQPDQIEDVILTVSKFGAEHLCEPSEVKKNPKLSMAAKLSIPFVSAVAITKGKVLIEHFLPQNLKDVEVLDMTQKISYRIDPAFGDFTPAQVEIRTRSGATYSAKVDALRGHPKMNPLSPEEIIGKFKDCARYSRKPLSAGSVDELINTILELEKVRDIKEITNILA